MRTSDSLPGSVLSRKAVVYVRQSTPAQVRGNLESQRRQYDLVDIARHHGFGAVEIIDEDLGLSAGGTVARPGFERLVAWLCAGDVGAVLCFEASRVARNGRDWHHILELCGLVGARVIDHDGVYDPLPVVSRLLGHRNPSMTLRYAHVADREVEAAAERIGVAIARAWYGRAKYPSR